MDVTAAVSDAAPPSDPPPLRFDLAELSGGLGDLGTFLPLTIALCAASDLHLPTVLVWAGVLNLTTGLAFRQPIPVQPMKAVAALAVAGSLSAGSVAAAGLAMGAVLCVVGATGSAGRLDRLVPRAVVRGLQLGVGLRLAWTGLTTAAAAPWDPLPAAVAGLTVAAVLLADRLRRVPLLPIAVAAGFAVAAWGGAGAVDDAAGGWFTVAWPDAAGWRTALADLVPAQLPLTLLNSVVAVCVLSGDLFPGRGIKPDRTAWSVGLMNLVTVPLGGMPVCHGAGGLAGQYYFGARTGGAVILLGGLKVVAGALLGGFAAGLLAAYPPAVLAVLVVAAGGRLALAARHCRGPAAWVTAGVTAAGILALGTAWGVLAGWLLSVVLRPPPTPDRPTD